MDWPIIHSYTRAQAIDDGVLVDVTETAREAGFRIPVALTRAVWERYVEVPPRVECQDVPGRLWDVVWMTRRAILRAGGCSPTFFSGREVRIHLRVRNDNRRPRPVELKAICGPGDAGEPVVTILLPEED